MLPETVTGTTPDAATADANGQRAKGGAPKGNINALKGNSRGRVIILGAAPKGFDKEYGAGRKRYWELRAEYAAKYGHVPTSVDQALIAAVVHLVRAYCLHKRARQPGLAQAESDRCLDQEANFRNSCIDRLRSLGLAKPVNGHSAADVWSHQPELPATALAESEGEDDTNHHSEPPEAPATA